MFNNPKFYNRSQDEKKQYHKEVANANSIQVSGVTHRDFAEKVGSFRSACEKAGVEPTKRQASRYRRGVGSAYASR